MTDKHIYYREQNRMSAGTVPEVLFRRRQNLVGFKEKFLTIFVEIYR
jgi:hypothetical protein